MTSVQYTVRGIPAPVDAVLRRWAQATGTSLNAVVVDALTRAALPGAVPHDDLDWFIGSAPPTDAGEADAMGWLDACLAPSSPETRARPGLPP